ncbi:MAG TPA: toast rack family protein [Bacteroidales bacterium]|nr:toast rack family protein [Bacteroidales bacterium]HPF02952.1 toast rack family protein [Bacteroidales bacterium]HPI68850.1 toast rack family protein [Bacteroidales bacterium]HPR73123.1 toast rack family protein [Bacteroidales bacterium]HRW85180.1 toast rack family protein [Bacteroidales bacterium]
MMKQKTLFTIIIMSLLAALTGFGQATKEERHKIDVRKADMVKTKITFPAGRLIIDTDANAFFEGTFEYRDRYWKPVLFYEEDSETGYLEIEVDDDRDRRTYDESDRNQWNLGFNRNVRNEMTIEMVAGESEIDLEGSNLEKFEFKMVAGDSRINLRNSSVPFLEFRAVAGEAEIDLSGSWKNDLDAEIRGGVGELTLVLPANIGIKLYISGGLGEISAPGFDKNGRIFTNDLYGETKSSLYFDIKGGIGNINIRTTR